MKLLCALGLCALLSFASYAQTAVEPFPPARVEWTTDTYHGLDIQERYRYMEQPGNGNLQAWLLAQEEYADQHLNPWVRKNDIINLLERYNAAAYTYQYKLGEKYYFLARTDQYTSAGIYVRDRHNSSARLLVDPFRVSDTDQIRIMDFEPSDAEGALAFSYTRNGSDWREVMVTNMRSGRLDDHLTDVKFSDLNWQGSGFYYTTYQRGDDLAPVGAPTIRYHRLGTEQADDLEVVKGESSQSTWSVVVSPDETLAALTSTQDNQQSSAIYLIQDAGTEPKLLYQSEQANLTVRGFHEGNLVVQAYPAKNNGEIWLVSHSQTDSVRVIRPEDPKARLNLVKCFEHRMVLVYHTANQTLLAIADYEGNLLKVEAMPNGTEIRNISGDYHDDEFTYYLSGYLIPPVNYTYNLTSFEKTMQGFTEVAFDLNDFGFRTLNARARDGEQIPLLLIYAKETDLTQPNPTLLRAYGGFGVTESPVFDGGLVYFLKHGGVFVYAGVRGGGDYGNPWWEAGRGLNKYRPVNDLIDVATFLQQVQVTSPDLLVTNGGAHGGWLVAEAMVQRPELFKGVVAEMGMYDLIHLQDFTVGQIHTQEMGDRNNPQEFGLLYRLSPLHTVKEDVNYPATLLITSENDDRVPPLHSYKFAARLQNREAQTNPVFLRVLENAGHYGAASAVTNAQWQRDKWAFIAQILELE